MDVIRLSCWSAYAVFAPLRSQRVRACGLLVTDLSLSLTLPETLHPVFCLLAVFECMRTGVCFVKTVRMIRSLQKAPPPDPTAACRARLEALRPYLPSCLSSLVDTLCDTRCILVDRISAERAPRISVERFETGVLVVQGELAALGPPSLLCGRIQRVDVIGPVDGCNDDTVLHCEVFSHGRLFGLVLRKNVLCAAVYDHVNNKWMVLWEAEVDPRSILLLPTRMVRKEESMRAEIAVSSKVYSVLIE